MNILSNKPILAVETSGELCSAAVYYNEHKFSEVNLCLKNIHSEKIIDIVDQALKFVDIISLDGLSAIAVSSGPGSFTGLRIGMSAVKGLASGGNLPVIAVPTFEALALRVFSYIPCGSELVIANKVNIEEVYYASFRKTETAYETIDKLRVIKAAECSALCEDKIYKSGNFFSSQSIGVFGNISGPSAVSIAKWAYIFGKDLLTFDYDFMEPNYLKNFIIKEPK
ncbi:MAG: tRNA (adenosine(37)-N6)-threonylcarbamoyltransferase complex dimerization subunit type 1 TsaB [Ignavibacteria bacterium]